MPNREFCYSGCKANANEASTLPLRITLEEGVQTCLHIIESLVVI